ncbi:uncharacterized protein LOC134541555 [Bacillus rossius redtenbacheri]|uniref:uncharacterized protein LOC134541555 n=1 Tax=Bacillus rossius redtenbacheri TaxID=93214 RepID=UPI002FDE02E0
MPDPDTVPPTAAVDRVAVRIPPFWSADPEMWFAQVENQFAIAGITADSTKFHYVAGNLDSRYATEVRDILTQPPATGKYERLRTELVKRLSASQARKTKQLLETEEMGDRRPSQFLRHLRGLAGTAIPDDLLRSLWLGRLPSPTQAILAMQTNASLDALADLADAIADTNPQPQAAAVSSMEAMVDKMVALMSAKIGEMAAILRQEIAAVATSSAQRRSRSDSSPPAGYRSCSRSKGPPGACWYHRRFGDAAHRCTTPCTYQTGNDKGTR